MVRNGFVNMGPDSLLNLQSHRLQMTAFSPTAVLAFGASPAAFAHAQLSVQHRAHQKRTAQKWSLLTKSNALGYRQHLKRGSK